MSLLRNFFLGLAALALSVLPASAGLHGHGSTGGGGSVSFVASSGRYTVAGSETITYTATGAADGDLLVFYVYSNSSPGSATFSGSGTAVAATQVSVDGVHYQAIYAHVVTTAELVAHTFSTTWDANTVVMMKIVHGPTSIVTYTDWFQFGASGTTLTYPAHAPSGSSLGLDSLLYDYNATAPTIVISPGSYTTDINALAIGANISGYSLRASSFTNVSHTATGSNGADKFEGFLFEYLP